MAETVRRVRVGRIVGVFGVRGEVKLESWTEPRARIFEYQPWQLVAAPGAVETVDNVRGRTQGKGLVAALPGLEDRDAAARHVGCDICVTRAQLPPSADGEYYWADLEGLDVVSLEGAFMGRVSHLFATGANDVLAIRGEAGEQLIPFVLGQHVREVNLQDGRIVVDAQALV